MKKFKNISSKSIIVNVFELIVFFVSSEFYEEVYTEVETKVSERSISIAEGICDRFDSD
jgi:hypothetical protein